MDRRKVTLVSPNHALLQVASKHAKGFQILNYARIQSHVKLQETKKVDIHTVGP